MTERLLEDIDKIKEELEAIKNEVHDISEHKQDKVKLSWVLGAGGSILIFAVTTAWYGGVKLSSLEQQLTTIHFAVQGMLADRYLPGTAERDFALRDRHLDYLEKRLTVAEHNCEQHRALNGHPIVLQETNQIRERLKDCCKAQ